MTLILDLMHLVAATLLAVVGLGYEREEECDPVQYQPAAFVMDAGVQSDTLVAQAGFTPARWSTECQAEATAIAYPVL